MFIRKFLWILLLDTRDLNMNNYFMLNKNQLLREMSASKAFIKLFEKNYHKFRELINLAKPKRKILNFHLIIFVNENLHQLSNFLDNTNN